MTPTNFRNQKLSDGLGRFLYHAEATNLDYPVDPNFSADRMFSGIYAAQREKRACCALYKRRRLRATVS